MTAVLVLEDGMVYKGESFGARVRQVGEVVFNTGMTGYQEVLTDPSYTGQVVTMTYPLVGNYGINREDAESGRPQVRGFVVRECCDHPSNWRSLGSLHEYLAQHGIPGLAGIDTRSLVRRLRTAGTMRGVLSTLPGDGERVEDLLALARSFQPTGPDLVRSVTTSTPYRLPGDGPRVVVMDFGIKRNILNMLSAKGFDLVVVPCTATAAEIMALSPCGLFLSNGPGDPKDVPEAVAVVRQLTGRVPVFGICLGHQLIALGLGADTYKLKFGHRGANHPVMDLATKKVYITSQNHGYAVDGATLPAGVAVTHINLNDRTVEGLAHRTLSLMSVQYHPEAMPGPQDSRYLFDRFEEMIKTAC